TGITDGSGAYSLTLNAGKYIVVEKTQAGWTESFPAAPDIVAATGTAPSDFGWSVILSGAQTDTGHNFGNFQQATKSGIKFNDLNANGALDSGEPGLSGWTILAYADTGSVPRVLDGRHSLAASATTGSGGAYSLTLAPGSYIVTEKTQAGWTESFPTGSGNY